MTAVELAVDDVTIAVGGEPLALTQAHVLAVDDVSHDSAAPTP